MSGDATVTHADLSKLVKKQQEAIDAVRELIEAVRINTELLNKTHQDQMALMALVREDTRTFREVLTFIKRPDATL